MSICPGLCPHRQGLSPPDLLANHEPVSFSVTRDPRRFCNPSKGSRYSNLTQDPSDQDLGQVQSPLTATKGHLCPRLRYRSRRHKGSVSWFSREQWLLIRRNEHQRHGLRKRSLIYWTPLKCKSSLWKTQDSGTCPRRRKKYCSLTLDKSDIPTIQCLVVKVPPEQECWVWRRLDHILSFRPIWVTESDPCNKLRVAMT